MIEDFVRHVWSNPKPGPCSLVIADLGAGEGTVSQLLARRAKHVIAVDNSEKMVEYGANLARNNVVEKSSPFIAIDNEDGF